MILNFEKHGDAGVPIVILHGFLGSGENWRSIAKKLSEHSTVYLPDLRNHGKSDHDREMDYESMSRDLASMISDKWSLNKVHLVGHSMGGKVAMHFNTMYPQLVEHLYVIDISARAYKGGHESILDAMENLDLTQVQKRSDANLLLSDGIPDQTVRQFLLKNVVRTDQGNYEWRIALNHLIDNYQNLQVEIDLSQGKDTPTTLLYGSRSNYVQPVDIDRFREVFNQLEVHSFEAGHWLHAEHPRDVISLISDTIKNVK